MSILEQIVLKDVHRPLKAVGQRVMARHNYDPARAAANMFNLPRVGDATHPVRRMGHESQRTITDYTWQQELISPYQEMKRQAAEFLKSAMEHREKEIAEQVGRLSSQQPCHTVIDMPDSRVQLHIHGRDSDHCEYGHLKTYNQEHLVQDKIIGYELAMACHKAVNLGFPVIDLQKDRKK